MWALTFILPLAVCLTHWTYGWLGKELGVDPWFVFSAELGVLLAVLSASVAWLVHQQKIGPSPGPRNWNGVKVGWIYVAMGMSATEGLLMSCNLLGRAPVGYNTCDYHFGLPIAATTAALWLFMFVWIVVKNVKSRPPKHPEPLRRTPGAVR